jgi:glycosyltransferase involved in cell wall biosynthesis
MRLVVLVHGQNLNGMTFASDRPNPGIGGTQFTRIRLADAFARRFPEHTMNLWTEQPIGIPYAPANLRLLSGPLDAFLEDLADADDDWVLTGPSMLLRQVPADILQRVARRTIITSHLMHDADLWEAERIARFGAAGGTGSYHFHATRSRSPKVYLRDLFLPGWAQPVRSERSCKERSSLRIVHVGALLPLKGFEDLARIWGSIRREVPDVTLDVIGGADLYSTVNDHPLLPTTRAFGDRILQHIPEADIEVGRVRFHGRLGLEKADLIRAADVAVLNVANRHECFPAAALECLDLGTPVVGSAANGLWDSMRHLPELATRLPKDVPPILARLRQHPEELDALRDRGQAVAADFRAENDAIVERWETVASALLERRTPPSFAPTPRPAASARLWSDWARRRLRYELRRSRTGEAAAAILRGRRRRCQGCPT